VLESSCEEGACLGLMNTWLLEADVQLIGMQLNLVIMKLNKNLILNSVNIDGVVVFLSVFATLYFSYIPLLYFFNYTKLDKEVGFILVVLCAFGLKIIQFLFEWKIDKGVLFVFSLSLLFPIYVLIRVVYEGNLLNDNDHYYFRTISVVNILFIVLSLSCRNRKSAVIGLLFWFSFSYVAFSLYSFFTGNIVSGEGFKNIFIDLKAEDGFYQNINTYLGMFVILIVSKLAKTNWLMTKILLRVLFICSFLVMLAVGGRTGFMSSVLVLIFYVFMSLKTGSFSIRPLSLFLFLIVAILSALILISSNTMPIFRNATTLQRIFMVFEEGDSSMRIFLFTKAIELFLFNSTTFLFGGGINSFPVFIGSDSVGMYPHNIFLELLAEHGVIGCVTFFMPIAYMLSIRKLKLKSIYGNSQEERMIFLLFLYFWIINSFTGGLRNSWVLIFFSYILFPQKNNQLHFGKSAKMLHLEK